MKVKVISLPYIFQVLYVLCFTRPSYQLSVYRTIGPLVYTWTIIISFRSGSKEDSTSILSRINVKKMHKLVTSIYCMKVEFVGGGGGGGGGGGAEPLCYLSHVLVKMEPWIVAKFTPSIVIVQNFIINQTL